MRKMSRAIVTAALSLIVAATIHSSAYASQETGGVTVSVNAAAAIQDATPHEQDAAAGLQDEIAPEGVDRNFEAAVSGGSTWLFTPDITGYYRLRTLYPVESYLPVDAAMNVYQDDDDTDYKRGKLIAEGDYATSVYLVEGVEYRLVFTSYTMSNFPTYRAKIALEEAVVLPDDVWMSKRNYNDVFTITTGGEMTIDKIGTNPATRYDVHQLYNATQPYNDNDLFYDHATHLTVGEGYSDVEIGYFYNLIWVTFPKTIQAVRGLQNITSLIRADLPSEARLEDIHTSLFAGTLVKLAHVEEFLFWNNNAVVYAPIAGSTETYFPLGTDYVAADILRNQTQLVQIHFCEGIRNIGKRAFMGCSNNQKALLPSALTTIQEDAFRGNTSLKEVSIVADKVSGLKTIGDRAFLDCPSIGEIYIPKSVEKIGQYALGYVTDAAGNYVVGMDPATNMSKMIILCEQNSTAHQYAVANGIRYKIINWDYQPGFNPTTDLVGAIEQYDGGLYRILSVIPGNLKVSYIRPVNKNRTQVTIPSTISCYGGTFTVDCVDAYAFQDCKKLKSVTVAGSVTRIGKYAFSGCKNLKKIKIRGINVKSVGKKAFQGIHQKAVIYLPKLSKTKFLSYKKRFSNKGQGKSVKIKK